MLVRRWTTATVIAMVSIGFAVPAVAAPGDPADKPISSKQQAEGDRDSAAEREPLTPAQVAEQVKEATALQEQLKKDDAAIAAASSELAKLSAASNALMSKVSAARTAEAEAKKKEDAELARLKRLTAEVAAAQKDLEGMAVDAYVNGPGLLRQVAAVIDIVAGGGEGADAAAKADYLANSRSADEQHFAELAKKQQESAKKAAAARADREKKTAAAEAAQKAAATAVAEQQKSVVALQKLAAERRGQLEDLGVADGTLGGVDLASLEKIATTPLCTEENASYPNGQWPGSALCALESAPGHMLRPSAARAFDALSAAYQKANGTNLCITDSYRSLPAQIDVKRRKPTLAARPGTSQHGLGLAVDLCGGIESFGTQQHLWMQQHAPLFGFFHPSWAQAGGSKPEPWHWEFAG